MIKLKKPNRGDVIINEIHIDPSPPIHLPEAEYIELFNPSSSDIELENCILYDDKSSIKTTPANNTQKYIYGAL